MDFLEIGINFCSGQLFSEKTDRLREKTPGLAEKLEEGYALQHPTLDRERDSTHCTLSSLIVHCFDRPVYSTWHLSSLATDRRVNRFRNSPISILPFSNFQTLDTVEVEEDGSCSILLMTSFYIPLVSCARFMHSRYDVIKKWKHSMYAVIGSLCQLFLSQYHLVEFSILLPVL